LPLALRRWLFMEWMPIAEITSGLVFPEVLKDGSIGATPLTPQAINLILKKRYRLAGLIQLTSAPMGCDLAL
jgi:hypothetical protein